MAKKTQMNMLFGAMGALVLLFVGQQFFFHSVIEETSPVAKTKGKDFRIEVLSRKPKIQLWHNFLAPRVCEHFVSLGLITGMEIAKIVPYGGSELIQSTTRTNTAAWLQFQQDPVLSEVENRIAELTGSHATWGESMQILRYEPGQEFQEHRDMFDPETDPPENFEPGGNRKITVLMFLRAPREGGETFFSKLDLKIKPKKGDAIAFWDLMPDGNPDLDTVHAGLPPIVGEKWIATKWIHERPYQIKWMERQKKLLPQQEAEVEDEAPTAPRAAPHLSGEDADDY